MMSVKQYDYGKVVFMGKYEIKYYFLGVFRNNFYKYCVLIIKKIWVIGK